MKAKKTKHVRTLEDGKIKYINFVPRSWKTSNKTLVCTYLLELESY